jgi:hypothetical protein
MPPDLTWLDVFQKLGVPLGTLVIVLVLGARKVWCFGYQLAREEQRVAETKAECDARLTAAQRREDEWKELALTGGHLATEAVRLARDRTPGR